MRELLAFKDGLRYADSISVGQLDRDPAEVATTHGYLKGTRNRVAFLQGMVANHPILYIDQAGIIRHIQRA